MEAVKFLRSTHISRQTFLGKTFDIFHAFSALHNVLFEQYDSPVSATLIPDVDTGLFYAGYCRFRVWNSQFPRKSCFPSMRTTWDKCWMIFRDMNFRIYLSLFAWKENILFKQHIVLWCFSWLSQYHSSSSEGGRTHGLFLQTAVKQEQAARRSEAFKIFLHFSFYCQDHYCKMHHDSP